MKNTETLTIFVKGKEGPKPLEIKARATKSPCLFVHRTIYRDEETKEWSITHRPTGRALLEYLPYLNNALKACNDHLASINDWESLTEENQLEFFEKNKEIITKAVACARNRNR